MRRLWFALSVISFANATQDPVFRSDTRLVQINVIVQRKKGSVADLKKEDFTLIDKGKPQVISVFAVSSSEQESHGETLPGVTSCCWTG